MLGLVSPPKSQGDDDQREAKYLTFTVDVTQDQDTNRQIDVDPVEGQATFSRGDAFIVDGPIYPSHTLASGQPNNDPKAPGGIGTYRLRGTFLANADDFNRAVGGDLAAPRVISFATEMFSFSNDESTILTEGEWPNARRAARRAVTGGTGRFAGVVGEAVEENIGENKQGFCNSRVTFRLRKGESARGQ